MRAASPCRRAWRSPRRCLGYLRCGGRGTGAGLSAGLIFANWSYTLIVILPVNKRLEATPPEAVRAETRALIKRWGDLHAVRGILGLAAALVFLWALN